MWAVNRYPAARSMRPSYHARPTMTPEQPIAWQRPTSSMDPTPPEGWETQPDGIGVLKSNTGLRDAIQKALQGLMDDGTYKTIVDHYGIQQWPSATVNAGQEE